MPATKIPGIQAFTPKFQNNQVFKDILQYKTKNYRGKSWFYLFYALLELEFLDKKQVLRDDGGIRYTLFARAMKEHIGVTHLERNIVEALYDSDDSDKITIQPLYTEILKDFEKWLPSKNEKYTQLPTLENSNTENIIIQHDNDNSLTFESLNPNVVSVGDKDGLLTVVDNGETIILASNDEHKVYYKIMVKNKTLVAPVPDSKGIKTNTAKSNIIHMVEHTDAYLSDTDGYINGYGYVDFGLESGTLWAVNNLGSNLQNPLGAYYPWGQFTIPVEFNYESLKYWKSGRYKHIGIYFKKYGRETKYGHDDELMELELEDDAARHHWGGSWKIPTSEQWNELNEICVWNPTVINGIRGYKVSRDVGGNKKSIFFPAAGYRCYNFKSAEETGFYWSSMRNDEAYLAQCFVFDEKKTAHSITSKERFYGMLIRPVAVLLP